MLLPILGNVGVTPGSPGAVTIVIASNRHAMLLADMASLTHPTGSDLHIETLEQRTRRNYGKELKSPAVLLLDKTMLERLDGETLQTIRALANAIAELLPEATSSNVAEVDRSARGGAALTRREQQVVDLLRCGCSNKEIARQLGVMEDTVKKHLQSVFRKFGVHRRALVALHSRTEASRRI